MRVWGEKIVTPGTDLQDGCSNVQENFNQRTHKKEGLSKTPLLGWNLGSKGFGI